MITSFAIFFAFLSAGVIPSMGQRPFAQPSRVVAKPRTNIRTLVPAWVNIPALAAKFDNRMIHDEKFVSIDYEHLFSIQARRHTLFGWHHDRGNALGDAGTVQYTKKMSGLCGAFKSEPIVLGVQYGPKTFFPSEWTEEQVVEHIIGVFGSPDRKIIDQGNCHKIEGFTQEGLKLIVVLDLKQSRITTAYPIVEGTV
jgi:hypothetical protein